MSTDPADRARRYVAWVRRHTVAIVAGHLLALAGAVYLVVFHLPLYADFSYLLPQDAPAVRDLRKLEARVSATDTALAVIEGSTQESRADAETELVAAMSKLPPALVEHVDADDADTRAYFKAHRHLFVPLADLEHAREALQKRIKDAKLAANPLFVNLDDDDESKADIAKDKKELDDLRDKRRSAEAKLEHSSTISPDGKIALVQIRTAFRGTDAGKGGQLLDALDAVRARIIEKHPDVRIGFTGGVVTAVAEHNAIAKGMLFSSIITTILVALVLAVYFRSARMLILLMVTLGIATAVAFGAAAVTVGHLNAATAFLGAIIAGNGVNYGILLIARYLEERKRREVDEALAVAIRGTLQPTAVASLGASIAYGSLAATSFKGFADFAIIGAVGMILCWIASYLLLPALVLRFGRRARRRTGDPLLGGWLVRVLGFRRAEPVIMVATVIALASVALVARYIAHDPFEYDITQLRSEGRDAIQARDWMHTSDLTFGRGYSGRTYIAADRPSQVPLIVAALRKHDKDQPPALQTFGSIDSILDAVPDQQDEKLVVLGQLRQLIDDPALAALTDEERKELAELRPPDDLQKITAASLPAAVREKLTEKDRSKVGLLISIRPANQLDEWNGHDLIRFANAVRRIQLDDNTTVTTSGPSVIFADIVESIAKDGPRVTLLAALGLVLMVVLVVGRNRAAVAVIASTAAGALLMVAMCALLGLKVNFLDFVALPITLGIGIDYAINIAHRHAQESGESTDPLVTLRTSGAAVLICSLTTIIGYGSLLVSENLAIRGFGTASLIGEVSSVLCALVLVPAILALGPRARAQPSRLPSGDQR